MPGNPFPQLLVLPTPLLCHLPTVRFDHVDCCGGTLSFIAAYEAALAETQRVLKPGGAFVFEVEARYNPDVIVGDVNRAPS